MGVVEVLVPVNPGRFSSHPRSLSSSACALRPLPAASIARALPRRDTMLLAQLVPGNLRQALLDGVVVQFIRLPSCGGAQDRH